MILELGRWRLTVRVVSQLRPRFSFVSTAQGVIDQLLWKLNVRPRKDEIVIAHEAECVEALIA